MMHGHTKRVGLFWPALCAVLLVLAAAAPSHADEMAFNLVAIGDPQKCGTKCPEVISAEGEIMDRTPDVFLDFIHQNQDRPNLHAIVFIHSPGGKVAASMELGRTLRRIGAAAVVARARPGAGMTRFTGARCFSACVYALMGGKKRVVPPESEVGIHRMFSYESGSDPSGPNAERRRRFDDGGMTSSLMRYSGMMGISPALVKEAEQISPDTLHIVTPREMARWHLGSPKL